MRKQSISIKLTIYAMAIAVLPFLAIPAPLLIGPTFWLSLLMSILGSVSGVALATFISSKLDLRTKRGIGHLALAIVLCVVVLAVVLLILFGFGQKRDYSFWELVSFFLLTLTSTAICSCLPLLFPPVERWLKSRKATH